MYVIKNEGDAKEVINNLKSYLEFTQYPHSTNMYGIGFWLKKSFNIPQFIRLDNWELHHGPPVSNSFNPSHKNISAHFLFYNSEQKDNYLDENKEGIVVGSSFVHCRKINNISKMHSAKGTVAFPVHTIHAVDLIFDWNNYIKSLLELPDKFQPVSVCLYYREILSGIYKNFIDKGMTVYCAGHMCEINFPVNFYRILQQFIYSTSNFSCSSGYYSIEMGIPFFIYGDIPSYFNHGNQPGFVENQETPLLNENIKAYEIIKKEIKMTTYDLNSDISISPDLKKYIEQKLGCSETYKPFRIYLIFWKRYIRLLVGNIVRIFT
jgi:hypothetical protein